MCLIDAREAAFERYMLTGAWTQVWWFVALMSTIFRHNLIISPFDPNLQIGPFNLESARQLRIHPFQKQGITFSPVPRGWMTHVGTFCYSHAATARTAPFKAIFALGYDLEGMPSTLMDPQKFQGPKGMYCGLP